jgi:hypothetical protein|tara:strand:- start:207 stop:665 length:459 start_codon:yes stop_codon:yes gene_type:complete
MPNWCENRVMISAEKKEDMKEFKKKAFKENKTDGAEIFQFNNLIPMPEELDIMSGFTNNKEKKKELEKKQKENVKKYGFKDWYDWRNAKWGTKWDVEAMTEYEDDKSLEMEFETAWAPPTEVYYHIYKNFPNLEISWFYHEPGMQISGYLNN